MWEFWWGQKAENLKTKMKKLLLDIRSIYDIGTFPKAIKGRRMFILTVIYWSVHSRKFL